MNCFPRFQQPNKKSSAVNMHLMGASVAKLFTLTFELSDNMTAFNFLKILHILENVMI